jgi:hypothetical protein
VTWPQISDSSNNPAKIKQLLVAHDIAGRIRGKSQGSISRGETIRQGMGPDAGEVPI